LATVLDVIRFVAEGIRSPGDNVGVIVSDKDATDGELVEHGKTMTSKEHASATTASFLAMAIGLSVFPQLDSLTSEARQRAVRHILAVFGAEKLLMRRMEDEAPVPADPTSNPDVNNAKSAKGKRDASAHELHLRFVEHPDPSDFDADSDRYVSIPEFLVEELCQQYRGTSEADEFRSLLQAPLAAPVDK
jgi:hypothetical protein